MPFSAVILQEPEIPICLKYLRNDIYCPWIKMVLCSGNLTCPSAAVGHREEKNWFGAGPLTAFHETMSITARKSSIGYGLLCQSKYMLEESSGRASRQNLATPLIFIALCWPQDRFISSFDIWYAGRQSWSQRGPLEDTRSEHVIWHSISLFSAGNWELSINAVFLPFWNNFYYKGSGNSRRNVEQVILNHRDDGLMILWINLTAKAAQT